MRVPPFEVLDALASSGHFTYELAGELSNVPWTMVTHDSRRVRPGAMFCCVVGQRSDGHDHAPEAVASGAVALLCERPLGLGAAEIRVRNVREVMGHVAAAFHGDPSRSLEVVGVTGTNGKTTVTWWLRSILEAAGRSCGLIGTLGGQRTTPEATDLQAILGTWRDEGKTSVVMEVSSHALTLSRVEGVQFDLAVFTNLGRDHLDFHGTEEEYFAAKAMLFDPSRSAAGLVNLDDPHGRLLFDSALIPTSGYRLGDVSDRQVGLSSSKGIWKDRAFVIPAGGLFNVLNAIAAATSALQLGVDQAVIVEALGKAGAVPGRFQPIHVGQPFTVIVDYAHTPDGLDQVLRSLRDLCRGRLIVVFGCGGDRDQGKRPLMAEAAAKTADVVVVTSDNPRTEDPLSIIASVVDGAKDARELVVEVDRRVAIEHALRIARHDDVVLVAGKGHETTQTIGTTEVVFHDPDVIAEEWERIKASGHPGASGQSA